MRREQVDQGTVSPRVGCGLGCRAIPPVLDADQVADLLHLASGREALKLARQQIIPSVKLGKRVLFVTDDIIAALRRRSRPALLAEEIDRT